MSNRRKSAASAIQRPPTSRLRMSRSNTALALARSLAGSGPRLHASQAVPRWTRGGRAPRIISIPNQLAGWVTLAKQRSGTTVTSGCCATRSRSDWLTTPGPSVKTHCNPFTEQPSRPTVTARNCAVHCRLAAFLTSKAPEFAAAA